MSSSPSPSPRGVVLHRLCPSCDLEILQERTNCPDCGTKLVEVRDEIDTVVGTVIDGRFEVRAKLGQGGMGTVYRAWQKSVGREVAVKLIDPSFSRDAMAVRRFLREARLASQLSQPNTVSVFDFGQAADGRLFIAMELIRGRTLHEVVQVDGAFSPARCIRVGVQICDALEAAHALGIVHRDLKLENVIILDHPPGRDLLKVLDFGLAKNIRDPGSRATESGIVVGTPRYMSPEAATSGITGPAGDLYGVGVILGELAMGQPMWTGETLTELIGQKLNPRPVLARIPAGLRPVLERLLDPDPERRPSADVARAMLHELEELDSSAAAGPAERSTANLRSPSPPPATTGQLTSELATARTETPIPVIVSAPVPVASADTAPKPVAPSTAPSLELARPPTRRWPLVAVGLGAIAVLAVTIVVASRGGGDRTVKPPATPPSTVSHVGSATASPPATAPHASPVPAPPTKPEAATPATVKLSITSDPAGASVSYGGTTYTTPFELTVPRSTQPLKLVARMPGRGAKPFTIVPDHDQESVLKLPARRPTGNSDEATPF